jgi:hypothetical protein
MRTAVCKQIKVVDRQIQADMCGKTCKGKSRLRADTCGQICSGRYMQTDICGQIKIAGRLRFQVLKNPVFEVIGDEGNY